MLDFDIIGMLNRIENKLDFLIKREAQMSATLDQVVQDVTDESTIEDSLIALISGIQTQLTAALAGTTISPANQAKIDAVFSGLEANKTKLAAAVTANTPAAPAA
jgi:TATA-binding protein-associated factor Taf7